MRSLRFISYARVTAAHPLNAPTTV